MIDENTILAQFLTQGDEQFIASLKAMSVSMKTTGDASKQLQDRLTELYNQEKIDSKTHLELSLNLGNITKVLNIQEKERIANLKTLAIENERNIAIMSRENAEIAKVVQKVAQLNSTSLGRFTAQLYGGAAGLEKIEQSSYEASRQAAAFSRAFVSQPIQTLKAFTASTEKAAIASQFLKEQLAFVVDSRFGTIMIGFAIFGTAAKLIKDAGKAMIDLDTATKHVSSAFLGITKTGQTYHEIQQRLIAGAIQFGQKYEDVAKVLWELKSAGLSVTETFAGQETVQKLIIAGATDLNMTARLTAGLYRAFKDEIKGAYTEQDKFAEIGGEVAYVLNKSQANMDDLMQSYKYATGIAKATGVSFNELSAAILVANNRLLFGSTAGTGFAQALLNIAKNWRKFAKDFDITIDPTKTLNYIDFINQLAKNQDLVNAKIEAMGRLSEDSNVKALRFLISNIQGVKELNDVYEQLSKGGLAKYLDEISGEKMDTLTKQWDRFKESMKANAQMLNIWVDGAKIVLKSEADLTEADKRLTETNEKLGDSFLVAYAKSVAFRFWSSILGKTNAEILEAAKNIQAFADRSTDAGKAVAHVAKQAKELKLYASFKDILDDEEKYRLGLIEQGNILSAQIEKAKTLVAETEKEAIEQANINIQAEEYTKAKNKAIQAHEKLNVLLEKQRQEERANLDAIKDYIQKIGTLKTMEPAEQMEANLRAFEMAQSRLMAAKEGTEEWRKALKDVGDTTVLISKNINIAEEASKKAAKSFQDMVNASMDMLKTPGADKYQMQRQMEQLKESLDWKAISAETPERELEALRQKQSMMNQMLQAGIADWQTQQEMVDTSLRIFELSQKIADEDARLAADAARVLKTTGFTQQKFADINTDVGKLSLTLEGVYTSLDQGLNTGLDVTKKKIAEIIMQITTLATLFKEMPEINLESLVGSTQPIGLTKEDLFSNRGLQ